MPAIWQAVGPRTPLAPSGVSDPICTRVTVNYTGVKLQLCETIRRCTYETSFCRQDQPPTLAKVEGRHQSPPKADLNDVQLCGETALGPRPRHVSGSATRCNEHLPDAVSAGP